MMTVLVLAACASSADPKEVSDEPGNKADGAAYPAGVYDRDGATGDQLSEVMLLPDRTFIRQASPDQDSMRTRGTYEFTRVGEHKFIRFYDANGNSIDRYSYYLDGSVLHLRVDSSSSEYEPMFTQATGKDAWVVAVKIDWFDEAFDLEPTAFPHATVDPADLPAAATSTYQQLVDQNGSNNVDLYSFDLHGSSGFEARTPTTVTLLDDAGTVVATGTGADDESTFMWTK
jgi:hypothetical protein